MFSLLKTAYKADEKSDVDPLLEQTEHSKLLYKVQHHSQHTVLGQFGLFLASCHLSRSNRRRASQLAFFSRVLIRRVNQTIVKAEHLRHFPRRLVRHRQEEDAPETVAYSDAAADYEARVELSTR